MIRRLTPTTITLIYAVFSTVWIIASGYLLIVNVVDPQLEALLEIGKGLLFVAATSLMLYVLLKGYFLAIKDYITKITGYDEALQASEKKFRTIFAASPVPMCLVDGQGNILNLNRAFSSTQSFGYTIEEIHTITDLWIYSFPDPQYRQWVTNIWQSHCEDKNRISQPFAPIEVDISCKGGKVITFIINVEILKEGYAGASLISFFDISQRKRAEQMSAQFAAIVQSSHDAIISLDLDGIITSWNPGAEKVYGYRTEEVIGGSVSLISHEENTDGIANLLNKVGGGETVVNYETERFRKDGERIFVSLSLSPVKDETGRIVGVSAIERDITDHKLLEASILADRALLQTLIDTIPDLIFYKDINGIYLGCNKAFEQFFGAAESAIIGKSDFDFVDAETAQFFRIKDKEMMAAGHAIKNEEWVTYPDGHNAWLETIKTPYATPQHGMLGTLGISRDITMRKRDEEVRAQLAAIVQSSHDAIIGLDLDGIITNWNAGAEKIYGYQSENVIGKPISLLFPENKKDEVMGFFEIILRGEAVTNYETERRCQDGKCIDVSIDVSPIRDVTGRIVGASTIARDIAEKKQAERALNKVNRSLKALSNCNSALIHATDETQLLNKICCILIEDTGYKFAWVGSAMHNDQKMVSPVAQCGYDDGYLKAAKISWVDTALGYGPTGTAIRTGTVQINQSFLSNPLAAPWSVNALQHGYKSSIALPLKSSGDILGALTIYAPEPDAFNEDEVNLLRELASDLAFGIVTLRTRSELELSAKKLLKSMEATIRVVASTVEMRDPYTAGHQTRVAELAVAIAQEMRLSEDQVRGLRLAALIHDLGKINVPSEILSKPGKLNKLEYEMIKIHSESGYEILKNEEFPWPIAQIVYQHHERLDGSGYPRQLKTDEILLEAKILMVADVVEAMSSHRPYRPSLGIDLALEEISAHAGQHYDVDVVKTCVMLFREKAFAFNV